MIPPGQYINVDAVIRDLEADLPTGVYYQNGTPLESLPDLANGPIWREV